jgi:uncharacterized protein involved in cysteine biosynthesis
MSIDPMEDAVTQAEARPWQHAFARGFAAPWRGFVFLCKRPTLWRYVIVPVLLNFVITAFVLATFL